MVIKPWGYGLWENMQRALDAMFKETGAQERLFPALHSPLLHGEGGRARGGFLRRSARWSHTIASRPMARAACAPLLPPSWAEPLIVRPTSETIIGATYAKWVQSYRDLPILINQWANVVRWELRPRVFLRTTGIPLAGGPHRPRDRGRGPRETTMSAPRL